MIRFYRMLLHLYPAAFRHEYGGELTRIFADELAGRTGALGRLLALLEAVADVVPNALAVHRDILGQDLRYTSRALRRAPGFTLTVVLVVALGVGANTAAFSLADFVLVKPLPFPESDRLVKVWHSTPGYGRMELSPANFRDLREATRSFAAFGAYTASDVNLVGDGEPRRLQSIRATPEVLPLLGVRPLLGRFFAADSTADGTVVIGYDLWQSELGGDPRILGRAIALNGIPHVVIGVMPQTFRFPTPDVELWRPFVLREDDFEDRNDNYIEGIARLAPGATLEGARADLEVAMARLERAYPRENEKTGVAMYRLRDEVPHRIRLLVLALCGAALCILLLACANVASLLLARAMSRRRELAVRAALGAGRERLVRQLVTESLVLALLGGGVGVAMAALGLPLLARLVPTTLPVAETPTIDLRILLGAGLLVAATGLAFGLWPALRSGRSSALDALRDGARAGGGRRQRVRAALVVAEVTASLVLLISAGLLIRAVARIEGIDPGFRAEGVLTLRTALPVPRYDTTEARVRFYSRVLEQVRALPGVTDAAYATGLPMAMRGGIWPAVLSGEEVLRDGSTSASLRFVTPGYFSTLGIPLRRGRDIAETDTRDRPHAAVVSESFAARHWPGEDPIGKRFTFALSERTVVGVAGDVRVRGREIESEPQVYVAYRQVPDGSLQGYAPKDLVIRSELPPSALLPAVRRIVAGVDPAQPISNVRTLAEIVASETAPRLVQLRLLGALAAIALLIAGIGLHGLLSFTVAGRAQELGVRRALGAQGGTIVGMILREGLLLAGMGVVIGVGVAYLAARGMSALLAGLDPGDPATILAAVGLCLATALAGCLRPALRAARVDPLTALREG